MTAHEPAAARLPGMLERAREIADTVLFPAALETDAGQRVPASHLDLLASEGFYGLAGPVEAGGAGAGHPAQCLVAEALTGGCLTTALVWLQHQGALRRVLAGPDALREAYVRRMCRGERRAGVALGGTLPGPPRLRARAVPGGYLFDGHSPWVTGWGMIDTLVVAAREAEDTLVWGVIDVAWPAGSAGSVGAAGAGSGGELSVEPLRLVAASASGTVTAWFGEVFLPDDRVLRRQPFAEFAGEDARGLRMNGSLALGVLSRCLTLLGPSALDEQAAACRTALDEAGPDELPAARAAAAELTVRAATALLARAGARGILAAEHPQRLAREAMFVCVFGSRPPIRENLLALLTAAPRS